MKYSLQFEPILNVSNVLSYVRWGHRVISVKASGIAAVIWSSRAVETGHPKPHPVSVCWFAPDLWQRVPGPKREERVINAHWGHRVIYVEASRTFHGRSPDHKSSGWVVPQNHILSAYVDLCQICSTQYLDLCLGPAKLYPPDDAGNVSARKKWMLWTDRPWMLWCVFLQFLTWLPFWEYWLR